MGKRGKAGRTKWKVECICGWKGIRVSYNINNKCPKCGRKGNIKKQASGWTEQEVFASKMWNKLLMWIKDDIEYNYTSDMILNKIMEGNYDITHTDELIHLQREA